MGYVLKEAAVADVISVIRLVAKGETVYTPRFHVRQCPSGVSTPGQADP